MSAPRVLAAYDPARHRLPPVQEAPEPQRYLLAARLLIALQEADVRYIGKLRAQDILGAEVEDALRLLIRQTIREIDPLLLA